VDKAPKQFASETKLVATAENSAGVIWSTVVIAFGLYLIYAAGWTVGLIVVGGGFFLGVFMMGQRSNDLVSEFQEACQRHNVAYKSTYSDAEKEMFLGLSENDANILMQYRISNHGLTKNLVSVTDILNVELAINDLAVYKAGAIASLSAAAIGGIASGGAGAIVGSLAASQFGHGKVSSVTLKLRVNDLDQPLISIPFIRNPAKTSNSDTQACIELAEKWTNLIEVMRFRAPATPKPSVYPRNDSDKWAQVRALVHKGEKVHAIKIVIAQTGWGLKEAKDFVDSL